MFRFLAPVLGHAKLLACAGLAAGSVAVAPTAVRAWHNHHQPQNDTRQVAYDHHPDFDHRGNTDHRDFNRNDNRDNHDSHPASFDHHPDHRRI